MKDDEKQEHTTKYDQTLPDTTKYYQRFFLLLILLLLLYFHVFIKNFSTKYCYRQHILPNTAKLHLITTDGARGGRLQEFEQ